jgi:hypothetical protein
MVGTEIGGTGMDTATIVGIFAGVASSVISAVVGGALTWYLKAYYVSKEEFECKLVLLHDKSKRDDLQFAEIIRWNTAQELKIQTTWEQWLDNAKLKAAQNPRGLGKMKSPLQISDVSRKIFGDAGITAKIKDWYLDQGYKLWIPGNAKLTELEMEIARTFREQMKDLCMAQKWSDGECVVIAIEIAKEIAACIIPPHKRGSDPIFMDDTQIEPG